MKTPIAATKSTCLILAALEPTAALKKFTASLLTPTVRSIIASVNMKSTTNMYDSSTVLRFETNETMSIYSIY